MSATHTLTDTHGPDVAVLKTEEFDVDLAQKIIDCKDISKQERDAVRRLMKERVRGNKHETAYKLGKDIKHEDLGRFHAVRGVGLQALSRECRNALAQRYYWDVDIRNAQPTLLQQYAEARGWVCDHLKRYNENREEYLEELKQALQIDRWEAKEKVCRVMFGGGADGLTEFFVQHLYPELRTIMSNVFNEKKTEYPTIAKKPNSVRSMMAMVLQTEERRCLLELEKSLARQGRSLDVLIHDGGLVKKKEGESRLPDEVLRKAEKDIHEHTGYKVSLAVKPMETTLRFDDMEDDEQFYQMRKKEWEETGYKKYKTFYLREQSCFVKVSVDVLDNILMKSKSDLLLDEEAHFLPSGESFVKKWIADETRLEYLKMDFLPGMPTPEGVYNMFRGFAVPPVQGDFSVFHEVLRLIANGNDKVFEYIEKWVASMLQKPYQKSGICIIVKGKKGVGKDTYFDGVGRIIGGKHFHTTAKPEIDIFGRFNSQLSQLLFLKFEEANFETNRDNEDMLKKLITSEFESIEHKGHDPIKTRSCVNMVMTTNKHIPIPMTDDERRFMMVEASDEKRGDDEFWRRVQVEIRKPEVMAAYHHYLMNLDISNFSPTGDLVKTAYYHDVLQTFSPYHARFFQRLLEEAGEDRTEPFFWTARNLFNGMRQSGLKHDITEQRFGRDMKLYDGVLTKTRKTKGNEYRADPTRLEEFIKAQGWWIDY